LASYCFLYLEYVKQEVSGVFTGHWCPVAGSTHNIRFNCAFQTNTSLNCRLA